MCRVSKKGHRVLGCMAKVVCQTQLSLPNGLVDKHLIALTPDFTDSLTLVAKQARTLQACRCHLAGVLYLSMPCAPMENAERRFCGEGPCSEKPLRNSAFVHPTPFLTPAPSQGGPFVPKMSHTRPLQVQMDHPCRVLAVLFRFHMLLDCCVDMLFGSFVSGFWTLTAFTRLGGEPLLHHMQGAGSSQVSITPFKMIHLRNLVYLWMILINKLD